MLEAVLRCSAQSVVLSHNHPSGTSSFSAADIQCTQGAINALLPLGVAVLDHVLVDTRSRVPMATPVSLKNYFPTSAPATP